MSELDTKASAMAVDSEVPVAMRKVYGRLERWRSERKGGERIPPGIWSAAGRLAREHGVNQVSRVLHLEFNQLKRAAEAAEGRSAGRRNSELRRGLWNCSARRFPTSENACSSWRERVASCGLS